MELENKIINFLEEFLNEELGEKNRTKFRNKTFLEVVGLLIPWP